MFSFEFCDNEPIYDRSGNEINKNEMKIERGDFHFRISPEKYSNNFIFSIAANVLFHDKEQTQHYLFWDEEDLTLEQIKSDINTVLERKELFI
jgi:hypothetical protein